MLDRSTRRHLALVTNANAVGITAQTSPAPGDVMRALHAAPLAVESILACCACGSLAARCCEYGRDS